MSGGKGIGKAKNRARQGLGAGVWGVLGLGLPNLPAGADHHQRLNARRAIADHRRRLGAHPLWIRGILDILIIAIQEGELILRLFYF